MFADDKEVNSVATADRLIMETTDRSLVRKLHGMLFKPLFVLLLKSSGYLLVQLEPLGSDHLFIQSLPEEGVGEAKGEHAPDPRPRLDHRPLAGLLEGGLDGGELFALACGVWVAAALLLWRIYPTLLLEVMSARRFGDDSPSLRDLLDPATQRVLAASLLLLGVFMGGYWWIDARHRFTGPHKATAGELRRLESEVDPERP